MNLFVYGTLISDTVWKTIVRGAYAFALAKLPGYARKKIQGEVYPAMFPHPGSIVEGRVYFDLSEEDLRRLDFFEGEQYERTEVVVECVSDSSAINCCAYLFKPRYHDLLLSEDWSFEEFLQKGLNVFLSSYKGF